MKIADSKHIAERYVKALFDLAVERLCVETVERDMEELGRLANNWPELQRFLASPLANRRQQAAIMEDLLAELNAHPLTKKFMGVLVEHRRLPLLPAIIGIFHDWALGYRGEMTAEAVTCAPLDKAAAASLAETLGRAFGKKVRLGVREDRALLGGLVVKIGGVMADGSVAGKLTRLENTLKTA